MRVERDNRVVCCYSRPGFGKTTAGIKAVPYGNYICLKHALDPARKVLGLEDLREWHVERASEIEGCIDAIEADPGEPGRQGILIDDVTVLLDNEINEWDPKYGDKRAMWGDFYSFVMKLRRRIMAIDDLVVITMHERPFDADNAAIRGGPRLPSKNLTEPWIAPFHEVLRFTTDPKLVTDFQGAFEFKPGDTRYATKARCGVMRKLNPANIAEPLRLAGYPVPYHPAHEWMGEYVEALAGILEGTKKLTQAVLQEYVEGLVGQGVEGPHARWAVDDAYHRMLIRRGYAGGSVI